MNKFVIEECGECSSWEPNAKWKSFEGHVSLDLRYCNEYTRYELTVQKEDESTSDPVINDPIKMDTKKEMEDYINDNFENFSDTDCTPYPLTAECCPQCNNTLEPGL